MDIDQIKIVACVAAIFFNWKAGIVAALWYFDTFIFDAANDGVDLSFWLSIFYAAFAINIKFPSGVRNGLLAISAVNWVALVNYACFDYVNAFYICYPWIINAIDAYIIWQLLSNGGRQSVGLCFDAVQNFVFARIFRILPLSQQTVRKRRAESR